VKKIKLTNKQIVNIVTSQETIKKLLNRDFRSKTSYWLNKSLKKIEQEYQHYETARQKLLDKYAEKQTENGENFKKGDIKTKKNGQAVFTNDNQEKFNQEVEALLDIELEIDINLIDFDCEKEPNISIAEMMLIENLIQAK
jgi:dipeptidase